MTTLLPIGAPNPDPVFEPIKIEPPQPRKFTITSPEGETPGGEHERVRSDYVEDSWLPYLGPAAVLLARRIALILETEHKAQLDVDKWGKWLGLPGDDVLAACHRLVRYGLAVWGDRDPMLTMQRFWPRVPPAISTPPHRAVLTALPDVAS